MKIVILLYIAIFHFILKVFPPSCITAANCSIKFIVCHKAEISNGIESLDLLFAIFICSFFYGNTDHSLALSTRWFYHDIARQILQSFLWIAFWQRWNFHLTELATILIYGYLLRPQVTRLRHASLFHCDTNAKKNGHFIVSMSFWWYFDM